MQTGYQMIHSFIQEDHLLSRSTAAERLLTGPDIHTALSGDRYRKFKRIQRVPDARR